MRTPHDALRSLALRALPALAAVLVSACSTPAPPADSTVPTDAAVDAPTDTGAPDEGVRVPAERGYATLAEYNLFVGDPRAQRPAPGVIPYDVNAQLYADFAQKRRFLYVPPGQRIAFDPAGRWVMPVGSVLVKTFYYPLDERAPTAGERLLETRLLIRGARGWFAETYRWNDAQTEAARTPAGAEIPFTWTRADGTSQSHTWVMPNRIECGRCHGPADDPSTTNPMDVLGLRTGQMNRDRAYDGAAENQIAHLASLGLFDRAPGDPATLERFPDPTAAGTTAPLAERARAYLQANCAHCHSRAADTAAFSGLYLNVENQDELSLGVCKPHSSSSGSDGRMFDIVPGDPDASLLPYRMQLERVTAAMPPLGRTLADGDGVALVREWIRAMPARACR